jgi:hypothetical protein
MSVKYTVNRTSAADPNNFFSLDLQRKKNMGQKVVLMDSL